MEDQKRASSHSASLERQADISTSPEPELLWEHGLARHDVPALLSSSTQNTSPRRRPHAPSKTVDLRSASSFWLVRAFRHVPCILRKVVRKIKQHYYAQNHSQNIHML
jgi:hypothetical protein